MSPRPSLTASDLAPGIAPFARAAGGATLNAVGAVVPQPGKSGARIAPSVAVRAVAPGPEPRRGIAAGTAIAVALGMTIAASPVAAQAPLELEDCRLDAGSALPTVKARCGRLAVPENPAAPDGEKIELAVAVVPAFGIEAEPDPLVVLAGGPGQAATEFYVGYAGAFEPIRRERDILLVDQRGTGDSRPLDCEDPLEIGDDFQVPADIVPAVRECLESLPGDPRFYTTSVAVRDLDAVRAALGIEQVNLYGASYGTRVAQHYLRRYPARVRSAILDGVVPPGLALGPGIALEAERALESVFERCAASAACSEAFPALETSFDALLAQLAETPITVEMPDPMTGELEPQRLSDIEFAGAVRLLTYTPESVAVLPLLIDQAWRVGNYAPLAAQAVMAAESVAEALSIGMHNAVVCTEDAPFFDAETVDETALADTYLGAVQRDVLVETCRVWPRGLLDDDFREPLETDVAVLLLSGEHDPVTPPAFAARAAAALGRAKLVTGPGQGHGLAARGCVPRLMAEFVETAAVDGLDAACVENLVPTPFFIDFNGPLP